MIRKTFLEGIAAGLLGLGALFLTSPGFAAELRRVQLSSSDEGAQVTLDFEESHRLILTLGEPPADAAPKSVHALHAPGEGDRDVIIAVDEGHGGEDPGAIGRGGTREKDVTLAIARALAQRINAQPGMRAVLTRERDELLDLRERIRRAHAAHADMFISVHADSIRDRTVSGAS